VALGGQGNEAPLSKRKLNVPGQYGDCAGGASGTRVASVTLLAASFGETFTSHAPSTSFAHGYPPVRFSLMTARAPVPRGPQSDREWQSILVLPLQLEDCPGSRP
jgi:hypothetical protein